MDNQQTNASVEEVRLAEEKITSSRVKTLLAYPFYGKLLCNLESKVDESSLTMSTDGSHIYFNPRFVNDRALNELNFINAHEILHAALGHLWRRGDKIHLIWNYACDYAINGIIKESIDLSQNSHVASNIALPTDCLYDEKYKGMSAEEIYDDLIQTFQNSLNLNGNSNNRNNGNGNSNSNGNGQSEMEKLAKALGKLVDDHDKWDDAKTQENKDEKIAEWEGKLVQAAISSPAGSLPAGIQRAIDKLTNPTKDWREEIADFCQPEVCDYSFCPPDRRFNDMDFFLPDFNEKEDVAKDVLIVMDTSGSISQDMLTRFYTETYGAINQFGDKLTGWVMFFDYEVYDPVRFDSAEEMLEITPKGGGGTNFRAVFNKIRELQDNGDFKFSGVMFCTDGYDEFPDSNPIEDIPLLWVMTTDVEPPFGRSTRLM